MVDRLQTVIAQIVQIRIRARLAVEIRDGRQTGRHAVIVVRERAETFVSVVTPSQRVISLRHRDAVDRSAHNTAQLIIGVRDRIVGQRSIHARHLPRAQLSHRVVGVSRPAVGDPTNQTTRLEKSGPGRGQSRRESTRTTELQISEVSLG